MFWTQTLMSHWTSWWKKINGLGTAEKILSHIWIFYTLNRTIPNQLTQRAVSPINESMETNHVWIIDAKFTSDRSSDCGSVDDLTDAVTVTWRPLVCLHVVFIFCMHDVIDTIRSLNTRYTAHNPLCARHNGTAYFIVRHKSMKWS